MKAIVNGSVFDGETTHKHHAVLFDDGKILDVVPTSSVPAEATIEYDLRGNLLAPGFIDLQVNGGGGVLFNESPSADTVCRIGAAHRQFGTTSYLPTIITDDQSTMEAAIEAVTETLDRGVPGVLGIHIEGPFISQARRGTHSSAAIRAFRQEDTEWLCSLGKGVTLITLAPESVPPRDIARIADRGAIIAAGHTEATAGQIRDAVEAGLTGVTHLYNAMPPLSARSPGVIGFALSSSATWASIIVDGHHVDPLVVRLAARTMAPGSLVLVTDAMSPAGTDMSSFSLYGREVRIENGRCVNAEGNLAGSALTMDKAVRNMHELAGVSLEEALRMASVYPAQAIRMEHRIGYLKAGLEANMVALGNSLSVLATWVGGNIAGSA